jgi:c-mer proto-oncogene tyrosine kinase/anaplastic lymphoma kinase/receptor tyrosine kinase
MFQRRLLLLLACIVVTKEGLCSYMTSVCSTELDDDLWDVMSANGKCEPYIGSGSRACDSIFTPGETYVYILNNRLNGSQLSLKQFVAVEVTGFFDTIEQQIICIDISIQVLCTHYYLPCGFNGTVHVPLPICSDACTYLSETLCPAEWLEGINFLKNFADPAFRNDPTLRFPNCNQTDEHIRYLNLSDDCCSNGGITLPDIDTSTSVSYSSLTTSVNQLITSNTLMPASISDTLSFTITPSVALIDTTLLYSVVIPVVIISLLLVVLLVVGIIIGVSICIKRRKNNINKFIESRRGSTRYFGNVIDNEVPAIEEKERIPLNHMYSDYFKEIPSLFIISSKQITLQEMIGQGEFGIVYRAVMTSDDGNVTPVAVKTLKGLFSEGDVDSIIKESVKMSTFDHRNVLSLTGVCLELGQAPCIIMPFMVNGSLLNYLKKERANLTITENNQDDEMTLANVQKQLMTICLQVAEGMTYLSLMKFVHRDLAARNCMIDSNGVIKVADFGLSEDVYLRNYFRQFKNKEKSQQVKLPVKWMAIESLHDGIFSEKSDVWSYGVLMWEVFSLGKSPYPGLDPVGVVQLLDKGNRLTPPNNAACSDEIYKLMLSCWEGDPNERPHFDDLLKSINDIIKPLADYTTLISNEL